MKFLTPSTANEFTVIDSYFIIILHYYLHTSLSSPSLSELLELSPSFSSVSSFLLLKCSVLIHGSCTLYRYSACNPFRLNCENNLQRLHEDHKVLICCKPDLNPERARRRIRRFHKDRCSEEFYN